HALELARGAGLQARLDWARMPLIAGARALAAQGCITGASGRNWSSYGQEVLLPPRFSEIDRALLSDPQTSGGLLVSCSPDSADAVLALFHSQGFLDAAVIGDVAAGSGVSVR
ncbi:MAG: selenophosphate synthase, partial [Polaromonas sp.]|nr:selenophosphate synthase [Polaromonas sp.]